MCLRDLGIDDDTSGFRRVRRSHRLSDDDRGLGRGQRIRDGSKGLETMTEAAGARRRARVI